MKSALPFQIYTLIFSTILLVASATGFAQQKSHLALDSPWGSYIERDFPFFSHTLDARHLGGDWPKDNLTPRSIILKLGHGYYACFDTDLLRVALIWKENEDGEYLTMDAMSTGSYRLPNRKASAGQKSLPRIIGTPLVATKCVPGWYLGSAPDKPEDPRERSVDLDEHGLGPIDGLHWKGIRIHEDTIALEYEVYGVEVVERLSVDAKNGVVIRRIALGEVDKKITMLQPGVNGEPTFKEFSPKETGAIWGGAVFGDGEKTVFDLVHHWEKSASALWSEKLKTTKLTNDLAEDGFDLQKIALPLDNPWKRNIRLSAFDFFSDGRAAFSTFDGDVWIVENLVGDLRNVTWKRFASGLHDPIGIEISDEKIYVFDRNGIVRLHDENGDGEADFYENFCNLVSQTAETREFANDIWEKPGGGFYIAKGGQVSTTRGKHNGTVVEIAKDGKSFEVIATGFRMPYIGVDPKTGVVTASDQQGHWKPATPIHIVRKGDYYGFQPAQFKEKAVHPAPIDQPEIHIPHFVNQSGASQIWTRNAKLGPLNDSLIHVGYNRPEIFKVYFDAAPDDLSPPTNPKKSPPINGAVSSIMHGFPSGIMKPRIHPIDGSLWLTGFKIWGTAADQISGLYRVTHDGGPSWIPQDVRSSEKGILLKFDQPVDEATATNLANYTVDRWNYKQTHSYGSGNYKLDGTPGQETMPVASAMLSSDKKSVFIGLPNMKPVHSIRMTYRVPNPKAETPQIASTYLTVNSLNQIDLKAEGFASNKVDLTLKAGANELLKKIEPTVAIGKETATKYGCVVCHSVDGKAPVAPPAGGAATVAVGPGWLGLWGSKREFTDGVVLRSVDEVYLRESIVDPARNVQKGFETEKTGVGMPSYLGVLKDHEIDSIILYIKSLASKKKK